MTAAIPRRLAIAGLTLGFAMAGFFDGILLHQILQWHHLLSAVEGTTWRSLRAQVMADGLFHALMYALALFGLGLLWRSRRHTTGGDRLFIGAFMVGFGQWHVVDAILFHWLLELHHVRMDVENPIAWDVIVFLAGLALTVAGLAEWRRSRIVPEEERHRPGGPSAVMSLLVVLTGAWALRPNPDGLVTAVFAGDAPPAQVFQAAARVDARLVWLDPSGTIAVMAVPDAPSRAWNLYPAGAIFVSGTLAPEGCFGWARPSRDKPVNARV